MKLWLKERLQSEFVTARERFNQQRLLVKYVDVPAHTRPSSSCSSRPWHFSLTNRSPLFSGLLRPPGPTAVASVRG